MFIYFRVSSSPDEAEVEEGQRGPLFEKNPSRDRVKESSKEQQHVFSRVLTKLTTPREFTIN